MTSNLRLFEESIAATIAARRNRPRSYHRVLVLLIAVNCGMDAWRIFTDADGPAAGLAKFGKKIWPPNPRVLLFIGVVAMCVVLASRVHRALVSRGLVRPTTLD